MRGERALYRDVRGGGLFALPSGRPAGTAQRTSFIDNEVARAVGHAVEQVVLVGAGYDGRALRFAGTTQWYEVERPAILEDKRRRLAELGVEPPRVAYVGLDLGAGDLGTALEGAGHRADAPSLFVCEGLFPSLPLEAIASLCESLRARAPNGSVLVSTFRVEPEPVSGASAVVWAATDQLLRVAGARRRSEFRPGDPEKLMVVTGWRAVRSERTDAGRLSPGAHVLALAATVAPAGPTR